MTGPAWPGVCIVGLGGHARTKLAPAVASVGQKLIGIVSRQSATIGDPLGDIPRFTAVEAAISALPADTLFIIASPPTVHAEQIMPLLSASRDIIVEKPAFVSKTDAQSAADLARANRSVLIEGFMNRHSHTHRRFIEKMRSGAFDALDFEFTIPAAPVGTFREHADIGASNLYDMGCYFIGLLSDAGWPIGALQLDRVACAGQPARELLHLSGNLAGVAVTARIGVAATYVNALRLHGRAGTECCAPFIYGRPGPRTLTVTSHGEDQVSEIHESNAFEAMLSVPRTVWIADQDQRLEQIVAIAEQLERLGKQLSSFRTSLV